MILDWVGDLKELKKTKEELKQVKTQLKLYETNEISLLRTKWYPLDKEIGKIKEEIIKTQHDSFDKLND